MTSRAGTYLLRGATALTLVFVYLPLFVILLYAFNPRRTLVWPIPGLTLKWFGKAIDNPGVRDALTVSVKAALGATAIAAGSIFTFSLTLGDYITPALVSSTQFIGNVVYVNVGVANNLPFAAAFALVPVVIMIVYLLIARRLGAFESL